MTPTEELLNEILIELKSINENIKSINSSALMTAQSLDDIRSYDLEPIAKTLEQISINTQ